MFDLMYEGPQVAPQKRMEFGVEYVDGKGKPKKDNPLVKRFKTKALADKYAKKGNQIDKVGGKYTVVQVPVQEISEVDYQSKLNEGSKADRWFDNLKYYYEKGLKSPDLKDSEEKKAYIKLAKNFFSKLKEGKLNEAEVYKYKKFASKAFKEINDAMFNFRHSMGIKTLTNKDMKLKKKVDSLHQAIFSLQKEMKKDGLTEGKLNEKLARGLKPLLKLGSVITKKVGEDKLLKLSDAFEKLDDERGDDIASDLNMAIEKMQDGYASQATGWLKKFNKECKKALKEGKLNEATSLWKMFDAKMKLQDEIMDLEYDMKMDTKAIRQLHKDMEQEAEPEGGKVADKYGKQIDKLEKSYKKKKAEFKKLMAKLDKMEQY